jgi:hypothetical protein
MANAPINFWGRRCLPLSPTFSTQPNGALQCAKLRTRPDGVNIGKSAGESSSLQVQHLQKKYMRKNIREDPRDASNCFILASPFVLDAVMHSAGMLRADARCSR